MAANALLPPVWVVGFTGHRFLENPIAVAGAIREQLETMRREVPGEIVGCSSVAIGGDMLFVEACRSLGIPWIATLPFSTTDFRSDFDDAQWAHANELLKQAIEVQIGGSAEDRGVAYLQGGLRTVDESDALIAVWDGQPSRGTGGTAEVVAYARLLQKPVGIIDPQTLQVTRERFADGAFADEELARLNRMSRNGSAGVGDPAIGRSRVFNFFRRVDEIAAGIAPRFRRWVAASVVMNAIAAILSAAVVGFGIHSKPVDLLIFVLVAAAMLAIIVVKRRHAHQRWIRCRVAAEICRSALATWHLPKVVAPVWFNELQSFSRLAKSLRLLRLACRQDGANDLSAARERYLRERIDDQLVYFRRRSQRLRRLLRIFSTAFWLFSSVAIARGIFSAFGGSALLDPFSARVSESFLSIALPLAAGSALSLVSIFDLNRQLARSREMEKELEAARTRVAKCENFAGLQAAVERTENLFAGEFFEWFTLFKNPRYN